MTGLWVGRAQDRRLPLGPLEAFGLTGAAHLAALAGVARETATRWRRQGCLPEWAADRAAIALGHHPGTVWAEWWDLVEWWDLEDDDEGGEDLDGRLDSLEGAVAELGDVIGRFVERRAVTATA